MKGIVMIGAPGSGKSTVAGVLASVEQAVIVSGDDIREELYGDANIQGHWGDIQARIDFYVEETASKGYSVILDGTHYNSQYRKAAVARLKSFGYTEVGAMVVNPPLEICLARNAKRSRNVADHVIEKMHGKLQRSLPNINNDGFSWVNYA